MRILFISTWTFTRLLEENFHTRITLHQYAGHTPIIIISERNSSVSDETILIKEVKNEFFSVKCFKITVSPSGNIPNSLLKVFNNLLFSLSPDVCHIDDYELDQNLIMSLINNGLPYILDSSSYYSQHALNQLMSILGDGCGLNTVSQSTNKTLAEDFATIRLFKSNSTYRYMKDKLSGQAYTINVLQDEQDRFTESSNVSGKTVGFITSSLDEVLRSFLESSITRLSDENIIFKVIDLSKQHEETYHGQFNNNQLQIVDLHDAKAVDDFFSKTNILVLNTPNMSAVADSGIIKAMSESTSIVLLIKENQRISGIDNVYQCQYQSDNFYKTIQELLVQQVRPADKSINSVEEEMFYYEALFRDIVAHFSDMTEDN